MCIINVTSLRIGVDKKKQAIIIVDEKLITDIETIFIYTNMFNKLSLMMALNERYPNA